VAAICTPSPVVEHDVTRIASNMDDPLKEPLRPVATMPSGDEQPGPQAQHLSTPARRCHPSPRQDNLRQGQNDLMAQIPGLGLAGGVTTSIDITCGKIVVIVGSAEDESRVVSVVETDERLADVSGIVVAHWLLAQPG
jgi:hypothetical protein